MGDATAVLARALEVQAGLGQPASLRVPPATTRDAAPRQVDFYGARNPLSAAQALLSSGDWELLQHLGPEDVKSIDIHYYVEGEGASLSSPNLRRTTAEYPSPASGVKTVVAYRGGQVGLYPQRPDEAKAALLNYAIGSNFSVSPGLGGEALHWQVATGHRHLEALFTTMWLIHLDVAAGGSPTVRVDHRDVRRGLVRVQSIDLECEAAKSLPGVKMHVNSCNATQRALVIAACTPAAITGLGPRASRYTWARVAVTLYGGVLPMTQDVVLGNADATARAILGLAERFGALSEASAGLNTALLMYGVEYAGTRITLSCGTPMLHEETHRRPLGGPGLMQVRELAGGELVALSLFIGRAYLQSAAMALRSAVRSTGSRDVPGSEMYLRTNQEGLMREAGDGLELEWAQLRPNYLHHATFTLVNARRLWQQTGVVHCLLAGVVAVGSIADEVTQPLKLGNLHSTRVTDIPAYGQDRLREMVTWRVLSELLENAGENLSGSLDTLQRQMSNTLRLHGDTRAYAQTTARFVIAGLGAPAVLHMAPSYSMELEPTREELKAEGLDVGAAGPEQVTQAIIDLAEPASESDWVSSLLAQRGPMASTVMRRGQQPIVRRAQAEGVEVIRPSRVPAEAMPAITRARDLGWGPQPTSGEGLLCGARAVHQSLSASAAADSDHGPLLDVVLREVQASLSPEQQEISAVAGVTTGTNNFTVDQLTAAVARLGDYRLGVIHLGERGTPVTIHGEGTGEVILIANNGQGHWLGVGPGAPTIIGDPTT